MLQLNTKSCYTCKIIKITHLYHPVWLTWFGTIRHKSVQYIEKARHKSMCMLFLRCIDASLVSLAESLSRWLWFSVLLPCAHRFSCVIYPGVGERSFVCMCFLVGSWMERGATRSSTDGGSERAGLVRSEQLNLQPFQPVAPAPQNKWDFNSIRVQLLWPPHGRNDWTYPPPSWNTPTRAVLDPHTDTGVVLHIAEFLHSLASQSCFTLSLVFCSLSAAALLSLSLHHTTPFRLSLPFSFFHSFFFLRRCTASPKPPYQSGRVSYENSPWT